MNADKLMNDILQTLEEYFNKHIGMPAHTQCMFHSVGLAKEVVKKVRSNFETTLLDEMEWLNNLRTAVDCQARELLDLKEFIARDLLHWHGYPNRFNKEQKIFAQNERMAYSVQLGDSIFKCVDEFIKATKEARRG